MCVYDVIGGIHKYIEKFPDGHFRGKLYVFDNRGVMSTNEDVLGYCRFCGAAYGMY